MTRATETITTAGADLSGRTALVTGGGGGIGQACARRLAAAGAQVVVVDVSAEAARAVASEVDGVAAVVDLAEVDSVDELGRYRPDIVVNNAGIQHVAAVEDFPPELFGKILRIMVEAPFRLARIALPSMYERGWGRFVHMSSVHGVRASPYKSAYVSAKHAIEGLSKVIALEGAAKGVTSNCVNPAYVRTPLVEGQIAAQARTRGIGSQDVLREVMLAPTAVKRLIEPEEVAETVAYLCGPAAGFITGTSIMIDGGWTAH